MSHVVDVQIRAAAWQIGSARYIALCDCGWRGTPHMVNQPGRRAALREARKHEREAAGT